MRQLSLEEMKKIELEMIEDIDRFCAENDIDYFLCGGSLLGAVRHKGFIPWDDDIDIGMTRENYDKFLKLYKKLFNEISKEMGVDYRYEYSPESFTGTEPEFALEICNAVLDVWKPTPEKKVIINLPVTVEVSMPHVYANQVE